MIKYETDSLKGLPEEIKCPLSKLSIENGNAYCNQPVQIGGLTIEKACLGNIKSDIKQTCTGCKLKMLAETKAKTNFIKVEDGSAKCPAMNTEVDLQETCLGCVFFNKEEFQKMSKAEGFDGTINKIPCGYPNFPKEKIPEFINAKKKSTRKTKEAVAAN